MVDLMPEEDQTREAESPAGRSTGARGLLQRHPVIVGVLVGCTLTGIAVGILWLPPEWAWLRRALGGALGGAGVGLLITAPRIIG
jgi:hypothetical protein